MGVLIILAKIVLVTMVIVTPMLLLMVRRWRVGSIILPSSGLLYAAALLPAVYLLSMVFAQDGFNALLSLTFAADSVVMVSLGVLAMLLVVLVSTNNSKLQRIDIRKVIVWVITVASSVLAIQVLWQLIFSGVPAWLTSFSIVDSWTDVSLLLGLLVVLILSSKLQVTTEVSKRSVYAKAALVAAIMLILSIFLHTTAILVLLFVIAATQLVSIVAKSGARLSKRVLLLPGIVLVFSGLFILDSTLLNGQLVARVQNISNVSFVDIKPNWQGTVTVAKGSMVDADINERLFGPGVGSFADQWRVYKPVSVNTTRFWDSNFNYAVGFIPTTGITGGIVVMAAWFIFFVLLIRLLFISRYSKIAYPTLFIWAIMFVSPIDYLLLLIAFVLTGVLIRDAISAGLIKVTKYRFRGESVNKIVLYLVLPIIMLVSVSALLVVSHRVIVNTYLTMASSAMLDNDSNKAEMLLSRAKLFTNIDIIEQGYTRVAFAKLVAILDEANANKKEIDQDALQAALSNVLSHARAAIEKNPVDPSNYMALGGISEQLIGLKIQGASDSAEAAYKQAALLDPLNPAIPMALARLHAFDKDKTILTGYLEQSLRVKGNYIPALYEYALLKLSEGDKAAAAQLFATIVQIDNNNANALYYLANIYAEQDNMQDAYTLMKRVELLNPDNVDISKLVDKFKSTLDKDTKVDSISTGDSEGSSK